MIVVVADDDTICRHTVHRFCVVVKVIRYISYMEHPERSPFVHLKGLDPTLAGSPSDNLWNRLILFGASR